MPLDRLVYQARKTTERDDDKVPLYPHWTVERWPEPVETDALLRDIMWKLQKHVVLRYEDILVIALWIMFAWVHDAGTHSPMLLITSAARESGKTTTLSVASFMVPRSIRTVAISEAALYRTIEKYHPTFMIDEFDNILADDSKTKLSEVINSGHTRGDGVLKVNKETHEPELFSTFGPKAIGMIGRKLPGPTLSRCIAVELRRRKSTEKAERFRHIDDTELANLRSQLARWAADNIEALRAADPEMSEGFRNRHGDNWRIQFAIADIAGEEVAEQARNAAGKVEATADARTSGERLLAAIKEIRESDEHAQHDAIGSEALISALTANSDSEWFEFGRGGKPISQKQLAAMVRRFGISPEQVRIEGRQCRGYLFAHFADAWERYL